MIILAGIVEEIKKDCLEAKDYICEEGNEPEAKEACNIPQNKRNVDIVPKLMMIDLRCLFQ